MFGNKQSLRLRLKQSLPLRGEKLLFFLLLLVPVLIVFKNFFLSGPLAWGDAPYFFPEALKELVSEPLVWTQRGINFGGVNLLLWISPPMYLYGLLGSVLNLGNDLTIRLIFYFPSLILSLIGPYLLARHLGFSKLVGFFTSFVFVLNTYYLLLIDGGQVGISVAYGLFPFVIIVLSKFIDSASLKTFWIAILVLMLQIIFDSRITIICILTFILLKPCRALLKIIPLIIAAVILSSFWLIPLFGISINTPSLFVSSLNLSSLLNSLFIFAPHWPGNIFGKVVAPYFYFALVPVLVFGSLIFRKNKKVFYYAFLFLIFAFLAKGTTPPLGGIYNLFITKFPLGSAFRDESKFFIPLILLGGILIGETVDVLKTKIKIFPVLVYLYLLFLIYPGLLGKLNFNLGDRKVENSFETIYQKLNSDSGNFRALWFPEKHPLAFEVSKKVAISARDLVLLKSFASMNASNDAFNFLNSPKYADWLKVLGVKYLFLPGDARNINPTEEESKDWQTILTLVEKTPGVKKLDWGLSFPAYEISGIYPEFYSVKQLIGVVGPALSANTYPPIPTLYFEDGKLNPSLLNGKSEDSLKIYFNGKDNNDLIMSFLQKYFISTSDNISSEWAVYSKDQYLKAKYELLIRGYEYKDFDYGKGISFSTNKGEVIKFKFKVPEDGKYILTTRLGTFEKQNFSWILEEKILTKGSFEYVYENKSGFEVLNVVSLIPVKDFEAAEKQADVFTKHFGVVLEKDLINQSWKEVSLNPEGTLKYKLENNQEGYWIIFSQNYHPLWNFKKGIEYFDSVPVYSMVNGFYVEPKWGDLHIEFRGQEFFRWGLWVTVITALGLSIALLVLVEKDNERKNKTNIKN